MSAFICLFFTKVDQEGQARFRASAIHAYVFHVVLAVFKLNLSTAFVGGDQRPGEARFLQVEHQRALTFRFQSLSSAGIFPGFLAGLAPGLCYRSATALQRQPGRQSLAVTANRIPGERIEFCPERFIRGDSPAGRTARSRQNGREPRR